MFIVFLHLTTFTTSIVSPSKKPVLLGWLPLPKSSDPQVNTSHRGLSMQHSALYRLQFCVIIWSKNGPSIRHGDKLYVICRITLVIFVKHPTNIRLLIWQRPEWKDPHNPLVELEFRTRSSQALGLEFRHQVGCSGWVPCPSSMCLAFPLTYRLPRTSMAANKMIFASFTDSSFPICRAIWFSACQPVTGPHCRILAILGQHKCLRSFTRNGKLLVLAVCVNSPSI